MKGSIEKLEDFNFVNEGLWDKIMNATKSVRRNKSTQYGAFTYTENIGWHIGPNYIKTLRNDFTLDHDPESLEWLTKPDVRFTADILYISKGKIGFAGIWENGVFAGDEFFEGTNISSIFKGGLFYKGHFDATWAAHPVLFENGTVTTDPQNGLLGVSPIKIGSSVANFNLLSVPVGSYVVVTSANNRKIAFKLLKTIDKTNAQLTFLTIPNEKKVSFHWSDLKQNYNQTVQISAGSSFIIPGVINVKNVANITVVNELRYQPQYKVELNFSEIKQAKFPYSRVFLNIDANRERRRQAEELNKRILNGVFGANLEFLKKDIQGAVDAGEVSDLGEYISKLDKGSLDGITEEIHAIYNDLKALNALLQKYSEPEVKSNIAKAITDYLKPKKKTPSYVKTPNKPEEKPATGMTDTDKKSIINRINKL